MIKVHLIAGARPNFMKVAPLYHELCRRSWAKPVLVHTGQHYDVAMSDAFFRDLALPEPDHHLGVGSAGHGQQTARIMMGYDELCDLDPPDWTIVAGDVNSTIACALVAAKRLIPVAHLEAGLRSRDRTMPEEINRILTDHASDLLWAPSEDAVENLRAENIPAERISMVGNIMIDSLHLLTPRIAEAGMAERMGIRGYIVATFHRPANVDPPEKLESIVRQLTALSRLCPVVFPVHPRTRKRLADTGQLAVLEDHPRLHLLEPLGYIEFMSLVTAAAAVVTDSGGIQEETSYLGIPCLTVRPNTERPVTLTQGTNRLIAAEDIFESGKEAALHGPRTRPDIALWDGQTAPRVVDSLQMAVEKAGGRTAA